MNNRVPLNSCNRKVDRERVRLSGLGRNEEVRCERNWRYGRRKGKIGEGRIKQGKEEEGKEWRRDKRKTKKKRERRGRKEVLDERRERK